MKAAGNAGAVAGKKVGFKHIIWKTGANIHQETWVNTTGSWRKMGVFDRTTCGFQKTSTAPASNAQVEFRSDCANMVWHSTEVVPIQPGPSKGGVGTGGAGGKASYYTMSNIL